MSSAPPRWPDGIRYLATYHCGAGVPRELAASVMKHKPDADSRKNISIRIIDDKEHPACGQRGLFASRKLPAHSYIIDYIGEVHTDAMLSKSSDYTLSFRDGLSIDGERAGNEARFVNDYRGVAGRANVEFSFRDEKKTAIGFRVLGRDIAKGEEVRVSYGKGFWAARGLLRARAETYAGDWDQVEE